MGISLTLKRFHSIGGTQVEFSRPTFLVGCNGSGKTNLADAFAFLSEISAVPLQAVFDRRGGIRTVATRAPREIKEPRGSSLDAPEQTMGLAITVTDIPELQLRSAKYAFEVQPTTTFEFDVVREQFVLEDMGGALSYYDRRLTRVETNVSWMKAIQNWSATSALLLPFVSSANPFYGFGTLLRAMRVYSIEPGKLRESQDPDTGVALRSDGGNAASVVHELAQTHPEILSRLTEMLRTITPNVSKISTIRQGRKLGLRFRQRVDNKAMTFDAFSMSDGTLRAVGLLLALFQRPTPSVIVLEEPEATIHPGALGTLMDAIQSLSQNLQIIVTTHSPDVLDAKWVRPDHIRVVTWVNGLTRISNVGQMPREAIRGHLMGAGELLRSNALEPAELFDNHGQLSLFAELP